MAPSPQDVINAGIQRGYLRVVGFGPDGRPVVEQTQEAAIQRCAAQAGIGMPCRTCGARYPDPTRVPEYSDCADCRAKVKLPPVDFIKRPR